MKPSLNNSLTRRLAPGLLAGLAASVALFSLSSMMSASSRGGRIEWEPAYETALEKAAEQERVLFVALSVDEEGRCVAIEKDVYASKEVIALSTETLNVIGSPGIHKKKGPCKKYSGTECGDHRRSESAIREKLVALNDLELTATPQHLWLNSEGEVILSVPFELSEAEMVWCFAFALSKQSADGALSIPEGATAPRRVLFGEAYRLAEGSSPGRGLSEAELEKTLKTMKGSTWSEDRIPMWLRVAFTDHPDAVDHVGEGLGTGALTWGGVERLNGALDVIGEWSPASFAPILVEFADHSNVETRRRTAIALEQMGEASTARAIEKALSKEEEPALRGVWLRALGACGHASKSARKKLIKEASSGKETTDRVAALLALGWAAADESVAGCLREGLSSEVENEALAALCAVAFSRDPRWLPELRELAEAASESRRQLAALVIEVIEGKELATLEATVQKVSGDATRRGRIFFRNP